MNPNPPQFRTWPDGGTLDQWIAPDGWPHRLFRIGDGSRGHMLMLAGRGDMIEKYLEVAAHFAARGWAVTTFDWRGQGGSGRFLADPMVGHIASFGQWITDLGDFARAWQAEGTGPHVVPHVVLAHSMGGYLALRAMVDGVIRPDAAVFTAPMLGLNGGRVPQWLARIVIRIMLRIAGPTGAAWTQNEASAVQLRARQRRLTHSLSRYDDELYWRRTTPEISLGPPSWGWLDQAYRATAALAREPGLAKMTVPTFILGTDADQLVSAKAIRSVAARLPDAQLHMYGAEAAHEILREADDVRLDALARIDAFWDARAPKQ
ncbi:MAG: alpha/beta fold hydrolase [Sphingobium sp.]